MPEFADKQYIKAAQRMHHCDGELEIDDNAKVSRGDDPGVYVQAWVWVADDAIDPGDSDE